VLGAVGVTNENSQAAIVCRKGPNQPQIRTGEIEMTFSFGITCVSQSYRHVVTNHRGLGLVLNNQLATVLWYEYDSGGTTTLAVKVCLCIGNGGTNSPNLHPDLPNAIKKYQLKTTTILYMSRFRTRSHAR
jgi:hypothetical protein